MIRTPSVVARRAANGIRNSIAVMDGKRFLSSDAVKEPPKHPLPPFTEEAAREKVQAAEDAWNSRDADKVSKAYSSDSQWRNRDTFLKGREQIAKFLKGKWENELDYRLVKHYFAHSGNRIAVTFQYEYKTNEGKFFRAYGNEHWTFDELGYMQTRNASINDVEISESERLLTGMDSEDPKVLESFFDGTKRQ